jgi:hypothetical protein
MITSAEVNPQVHTVCLENSGALSLLSEARRGKSPPSKTSDFKDVMDFVRRDK